MAPNANGFETDLLSPSRLLALTPAPKGFEGPVVCGSPSSPEKSDRFEPAGCAFERKLSGLYAEKEDAAPKAIELDDDDECPDLIPVKEEASSQQDEDKKKKKKDKKKKKKDKDGNDIEEEEPIECYKVLGLEALEVKATDEDIKKAYRKLSLQFHPDKAQQNGLDPEVVAEKFKVIQEAYETLTNPLKRIMFDSIVPKSYDNIPTGEDEGDFYQVYGEAFERFSRWSEVKPCPLLGDANTPIEEVDAFYDFWYEFKSWRIIKGDSEEEHDLDDAEDAYERRWMNVENDRVRRKYKKEHMKTIATLRDMAFKRDPRVIAARVEEAAKKEAEKLAKLEAKRAKEAAEKAEKTTGLSKKEIQALEEQEKKAEDARLKAEEERKAKELEAASAAEQADKVKAAILARQKKAKDAAKDAAKKPSAKKKK